MQKYPLIMGILNLTPDSFSDGGENVDIKIAVDKALEMLDNGADIIDIGGESTRPGANPVNVDEEIARVRPVIEEILKLRNDAIISIDTTKYEVARIALDLGAKYINDISGLQFEPRFADLANKYDANLVIMHLKGQPRTMQMNPVYEDVVGEVSEFLKKQVDFARSKGVNKIYIDPGIGFGKTLDNNLDLLRNLEKIKDFCNAPMLLGISRKSFMNQLFDIPIAKERDFATAIFHSFLIKNAEIVRVHSVESTQFLKNIAYVLNKI